MSFVDFKEVRQVATIDQVAHWLGLELKRVGEQMRGPCPVNGGGDRALVLTPAKGLFYCFAPECRSGGDIIALTAHVKQIDVRAAALEIQKQFQAPAPPKQPQEPRTGPMQPLDYLEPKHSEVAAHGLSETVCNDWGAGYASKGLMRGTIAIPIHDRQGTLLGYIGVKKGEALRTAKSYDLSKIIFGANRLEDDKPLAITDDPIKVMLAPEMGMQAIAFLGAITPAQLTMLAILMEEKGMETATML